MVTTGLTIAILVAFILYSAFSKRIGHGFLTLPILFTLFGFFLSRPLNDLPEQVLVYEGRRLLAEITLVLVLFSDASHVRFANLRQSWKIPARMLVIGMPLTILLGTLAVAWLNPTAGIAMALLTASLLTPTDAALGQSVVSSPFVPKHLSQSVNVESGLNDGLVLPFVLMGAVLASGTMLETGGRGLFMSAVIEVGLGVGVGIAIGWSVARLLEWVQKRDMTDDPGAAVIFLCTAFVAYYFSHAVGGNGFIAAFISGMTFGNSFRNDIRFISEFMEGAGQLLTMSAFLLLGAFLMPVGLSHVSFTTVLIAVLFMTVIRMLPIYLSLWGSGLPPREKLFLGWFGPRGLASILFTLLMLDDFDLPNQDELLACVSLTVGLSIVLHGVSASPYSRWIGNRSGRD